MVFSSGRFSSRAIAKTRPLRARVAIRGQRLLDLLCRRVAACRREGLMMAAGRAIEYQMLSSIIHTLPSPALFITDGQSTGEREREREEKPLDGNHFICITLAT